MFLFVQYSALQDWAQHCGTVVQTADGTETPHTACARAKVWLKSNHDPSQNALWVVLTCHPLAPFHSTSFCAEKAHNHSSFTSVLSGFHRPALLLFQAGELSIM